MKILDMGEAGSRLLLEKTESIVHCNMGQGTKTCFFLSHGPDGFECLYKNKAIKSEVMKLQKQNKMVAKWSGCKWAWVK